MIVSSCYSHKVTLFFDKAISLGENSCEWSLCCCRYGNYTFGSIFYDGDVEEAVLESKDVGIAYLG